MIGHRAPPPPSARGAMGVLRTWVQAWTRDMAPSPDPQQNPTGRLPVHCHGSARVLVVDYNPVNLMVISALMEARGLVPLLAEDGAQAVTLACELPFDLILMDLQMPILDGFAATMAIRRFEDQTARAAVPVVAYSSTAPSERVLRRHGLSGSLRKPCEDRDLEDCLSRWCPGYRSPPDAVAGNGIDTGWRAQGRASDAGGAMLR